MEVRQKDVADAEVVLGRERQILVDITLRVDDDGNAGVFVGNNIGRVREAVQIELFQDHVGIIPRSRNG
jgi:hypothetical protein